MRFRVHVQNKLIPAISGTQVYVYLEGTQVLIPVPVYADASSGTVLGNPYTHQGGDIVFFLPFPLRVSIGFKPAGASVPTIAQVVTATDKAFTYGLRRAAGVPVGWVLT